MSDHRMSASALDRETASKLNPFIGLWPRETLERCASATQELGYLTPAAVNGGHDIRPSNLFRFHEAIAAALEYERKLMSQAAAAEREDTSSAFKEICNSIIAEVDAIAATSPDASARTVEAGQRVSGMIALARRLETISPDQEAKLRQLFTDVSGNGGAQ